MSSNGTPPPEQQSSFGIYIIGPQSTGKTTLVNALAQALGDDVPVILEVARKVMAEKGYSKADVDSSDEERKFMMQRDIFHAQLEAENTILRSANEPFVLSDRSAIDPLVYLLRYARAVNLDRLTSTDQWKVVRERYGDTGRSMILLLLPVEEFLVDDDIRYIPKSLKDWYNLAEDFRSFLIKEGIPFREIGDQCLDIEERVRLVLSSLLPSSQEW